MSEQDITMAELLQGIQELTTTVKEHNSAGDRATLDWPTIVDTFGDQIKALVDAQVKEQLNSQPVRGTPIGAYSVDSPESVRLLADNRYRHLVQNMTKDGYAWYGGQKVKPVDFHLAAVMLQAQHTIKEQKGHMPGDDKVRLPSQDMGNVIKLLTATGTGAGDEWVPTDLAAQLWEDFFPPSLVAGAIPVIPMPTDPFNVPLGLTTVTFRKGSAGVPVTAEDPTTAQSVMTSTEQVAEQNWDYALEEDAAFAMAPTLRATLAREGAEQIDAFTINADSTATATGNINSDDAAPASDSYYLTNGQAGLRRQWIAENTSQTYDASGGAVSDTMIRAALVKMGKYAVRPDRVAMVCDISTYLSGLLNLDHTLTLDKFGSNAVVLTGQLAAYRGIPILPSVSHPLGESDGKVSATAASNTLGSLTLFNRDKWFLGFRRSVTVEVDRDISRRVYMMVTSFRQAVAAHGTRSTNTHTAGILNILI